MNFSAFRTPRRQSRHCAGHRPSHMDCFLDLFCKRRNSGLNARYPEGSVARTACFSMSIPPPTSLPKARSKFMSEALPVMVWIHGGGLLQYLFTSANFFGLPVVALSLVQQQLSDTMISYWT